MTSSAPVDTSGSVDLTVENGLATITLDHPTSRNSLTVAMVEQFHDVLDELETNPGLGAVVVRGAGGHFCAGLDRGVIQIQRDDPASTEAVKRASLVYETFTRFGRLPAPTFAAVRGAAVGAGLNLAMAADLRVVASDARLIAGFSRLGLHPGGGFFALATRLLGREAAVALGVAGEELDGERAAQLGFAWSVQPDAEVEQATIRLARRCADDPELARSTIASFRSIAGPPAVDWETAVTAERGPQMWTFRRLAERES